MTSHRITRAARRLGLAAPLLATLVVTAAAQPAAREATEKPPAALAKLLPPAPTPASFVADVPDVVPAADQERIDARIRALQDSGYGDVGIAILPSIADYQPYEVGVAIYRAWRIGRVDSLGSSRRDLGVLLLIVPKELAPDGRGQCWITTGLGAEGIVTDASSGEICRERIIPHLRTRDYPAALAAGVEAIGDRMRADDGLAAAVAPPLPPATMEGLRERKRGNAGAVVATFLAGLASLVGGGAWFVRWRRNRPRVCPRCGRQMQRMSEQQDDASLTGAQRVEERIRSVDYDVWRCECGEETILPYRATFTGYQECERCHARASKKSTRTIRPASYTATGLAEETHHCEACQNTRIDVVVLPMIPKPTTTSSGGSSGFHGGGGGGGEGGRSFGGSGRTGGGGGGSSY